MNNVLEDPFQYLLSKNYREFNICYTEMREISQGGPEVGNLSINGKELKGKFGGPQIFNNDFVFLPIYTNNFFKAGFKIAIVDLNTLEIVIIGKIWDLILLDHIEENIVFFYNSISKTSRHYYKFSF